MKTIDMVVDVPEGRVVALKFPDDVAPGEHRVLVVIDEQPADQQPPRFDPEGLWADKGIDISPEDILEARRGKLW